MGSRTSKWVSGIGAVVLIGGLVLANFGSGVMPAEAADWKQNLPPATRFATPFTGAVLDKNTGLVWEQAPNPANQTWSQATAHCLAQNFGGVKGWRLPSIVELNSVRDPSLPAPFVPASAFSGVLLNPYWSATSHAELGNTAWAVNFGDGGVIASGKGSFSRAWCVRGPMNADKY